MSEPWVRWRSSHKVVMRTTSSSVENLVYLRALIEAGNLQPMIDRTCPLKAVVEAHRYVETEAKMGNLVITVDHKNKAAAGTRT